MEKKILFVDACPRVGSRTRKLAEALLETLEGEIETADLMKEDLPVIDDGAVRKRAVDGERNDFSDPEYRWARQFAQADIIVIAAPFWDMSFPAVLKKYIEAVSVTGITFRYSEEGIPIGLCRAEKMYYVSTAGGPVFNDEFGYGYLKLMAEGMYGIRETERILLENLDIWGNDPEEMLENKIREIQGSATPTYAER